MLRGYFISRHALKDTLEEVLHVKTGIYTEG